MRSAAPASGEEPILVDLAAVGFAVRSLADLRRPGVRYRDAIPVLVEWLGRASDPKVKGEIARALSVPWAKPVAVRPVIEEFRAVDVEVDPTGTGVRWTMGNALEVLFDDAYFDAFVELAADKRYGKARQMVVLGLAKSKRPQVVDVLLGLVDDPDVDGHAVKALAKLRAPAARLAFESKLGDSRAWVRSEARKGLNRLTG
ncbi:HEAT repeat domain-containing protein [Cellulomonas sp. NPDC058312]|uniref:HEAT repeat domain-containing protein n=1 Tax=Cellulomonas sp. NPDC058312 TaxID=3346441 RepID=UPI0036EF835A